MSHQTGIDINVPIFRKSNLFFQVNRMFSFPRNQTHSQRELMFFYCSDFQCHPSKYTGKFTSSITQTYIIQNYVISVIKAVVKLFEIVMKSQQTFLFRLIFASTTSYLSLSFSVLLRYSLEYAIPSCS